MGDPFGSGPRRLRAHHPTRLIRARCDVLDLDEMPDLSDVDLRRETADRLLPLLRDGCPNLDAVDPVTFATWRLRCAIEARKMGDLARARIILTLTVDDFRHAMRREARRVARACTPEIRERLHLDASRAEWREESRYRPLVVVARPMVRSRTVRPRRVTRSSRERSPGRRNDDPLPPD
jgi:hypothetical protein